MSVLEELRKQPYATVPKSDEVRSFPSHPKILFNLNDELVDMMLAESLFVGTLVGVMDAMMFYIITYFKCF